MAKAEDSTKKNLTTILVAVDGSKHSDYAVKWYADHVHRPGHAVLLVHASEPDFKPAQAMYGGLPMRKDEWEMTAQEVTFKENHLREKYVEMLKHHGVENVRFICLYALYNKPGELLVHAAKEHDCTMVVVGSRGLGTVRRTVMGSISDYVLHHSHIPVVVCPNEHHHDHHH